MKRNQWRHKAVLYFVVGLASALVRGQVQVCLLVFVMCLLLVLSGGYGQLGGIGYYYFSVSFLLRFWLSSSFSSSPFLMGENLKNLIHSGDLFICVALIDLWFMGI